MKFVRNVSFEEIKSFEENLNKDQLEIFYNAPCYRLSTRDRSKWNKVDGPSVNGIGCYLEFPIDPSFEYSLHSNPSKNVVYIVLHRGFGNWWRYKFSNFDAEEIGLI